MTLGPFGTRLRRQLGTQQTEHEHDTPFEAQGHKRSLRRTRVHSSSIRPSVRSARPSIQSILRARLARLAKLSLGDAASVVTFGIIGVFASLPSTDPDKYWHVATGRWIWGHHQIPKNDPFSWTAHGRPWIAHEWLTESIWYAAYKPFGWAGPAVLSALTIAMAFWLLRRTMIRLGVNVLWLNALLLLGAMTSLTTWGVRPQMISFAGIALVGWSTTGAWLDADNHDEAVARTSRQRLRWLPLVMCIWACQYQRGSCIIHQ